MTEAKPVVAAGNSTEDLAPGFNIVAVAIELKELHRLADITLAESTPDLTWPAQIDELADRLGALQAQAPDALLYLLFFGAARTSERYSSHHALVCAVAVKECAAHLNFSAAETHSLVCAALTMNLSITALQDELVHRDRTPTLNQRLAIDNHAHASVEMLRARGIADELWLSVVGHHHEELAAPAEGADAAAEQRLASVLQRIDRCAARVSPRRTRKGMPAMLAIRDAYLGNKGRSDAIGIAVTKALGIHPPGSAVVLSNGDTAIVLRRGERPSQPVVASLTAAGRKPLIPAVLRDTSRGEIKVKNAIRVDELRVAPEHERLWVLLAAGLPAAEAAGPQASVAADADAPASEAAKSEYFASAERAA